MTLPSEATVLLDDSTLVHVATIRPDGAPNVKVVTKAGNDGVQHLWWRTSRSANGTRLLHEDPRCCAYVYDAATMETLTLNGNAVIHSDADTRTRFWYDGAERIYRGGIDDPEYVVVELIVDDVIYTAPGERDVASVH